MSAKKAVKKILDRNREKANQPNPLTKNLKKQKDEGHKKLSK